MRLLSALGLFLALLASGMLSHRLPGTGGTLGCRPEKAGPASPHLAPGPGPEIADRAKAGASAGDLRKAAPPGGDGPPRGTPQAPALWTASIRLRPCREARQAPPDPGSHPRPSGGLEPEQGGRRGPPLG